MSDTRWERIEVVLATALQEIAEEAEARVEVERDLARFQQHFRSGRVGHLAPVLVPVAMVLAVLLILGAIMLEGRHKAAPPADQPEPRTIFSKVKGWIAWSDPNYVAGPLASESGTGIWAVDPERPPGRPRHQVQISTRNGLPLGWSADGSKLLVGRFGKLMRLKHYKLPAFDLLLLNPDGTERPLVSSRPDRPIWPAPPSATISPDGSRVVFVVVRDNAPWEMYAVDTDGGKPELLQRGHWIVLDNGVRAPTSVMAPTFSPDGTEIAYYDGMGDHTHRYWVMNADGTGAHELLSNPPGEGHANRLTWSPNGQRLAFDWEEGDIFTVKPDGTGLTKIIRDGVNPFWSPDGSRIAYTRNGTLEIADPDGTHVQKLPYARSGPWNPQ